MRALYRNRDFRLLLAGQTASMLGDWLLLLVLGMWAKQLTGSNALAGTVLLAVAAPNLLSPVSGWLADRLRRRPLMMIIDAITGTTVVLLLLVQDRSDLWLIYLVAAVYGTSQTVFSPAMKGLVHQILPAESLGPANGALTTIRQSLRLVGPLLGAALFASTGGGTVAVVDAATFAVSITSLAAIRSRPPRPAPPTLRFRTEVSAGIRQLRQSPVLRTMTTASIITMLALGLTEAVFFAVIEGLDRPVEFLGVIATFQGIGSIVAGIAVTASIRRLGEARVLVTALAAATTAAVGVNVNAVPVVLAATVLFGAALPAMIVASTTLLQQETPNQLMGRTAAAFDLATGVPYTASIGIGAGLLAVTSYHTILIGMATGLATATAYAGARLPHARSSAIPQEVGSS